MAMNAATNNIYFATVNNVTVIDGLTHATTNVATGLDPNSIVANPATNKIYVVCEATESSNGTVTVIDGATNTTTAIALLFPHSLAVNPVTGRI
jgi:DNA-binding beta-propeller fold protein YncE